MWFKDQITINASDRVSMNADGDLSVKGLTVADNGVYTCEASNDLGVDRKQVDIKIQEPVTDASVTGIEERTFYLRVVTEVKHL